MFTLPLFVGMGYHLVVPHKLSEPYKYGVLSWGKAEVSCPNYGKIDQTQKHVGYNEGLPHPDHPVCIMNQQGNILANQSVANDPEAVFPVVVPFGNNVSAAIEASTGAAEFADALHHPYPHWHVELAHPGYVARRKQTIDKSDIR